MRAAARWGRRTLAAVGAKSRQRAMVKLFCAVFDKILSLRSDNLLVNRLFQAIHARLSHAELHLILPILPRHPLRRRLTGKTLGHPLGIAHKRSP